MQQHIPDITVVSYLIQLLRHPVDPDESIPSENCSAPLPPTSPGNNVVIIASSVSAGLAGCLIILAVVIVLAVIRKKHKKTRKPK